MGSLEHAYQSHLELNMNHEIHGLGSNPIDEEGDSTSEVCNSSSSSDHDFSSKYDYGLGDKLEEVVEDGPEYGDVRSKLLPGFGCLIDHLSLMGIHRIAYSHDFAKARFHAFQRQIKDTKEIRGGLIKLELACYGGSLDQVRSIVLHGFGQPQRQSLTHGVGVYLATTKYSYLSALSSKIDENAEQHVVLCHVIVGNVEQVIPGSKQFQPSSKNYDIGVDDLVDPKQFIVWTTTHASTHILPLYVVRLKILPQFMSTMASLVGKHACGASFQSVNGLERLNKPTNNDIVISQLKGKSFSTNIAPVGISSDKDLEMQQIKSGRHPQSPWMSFHELFRLLRNKIPLTHLATLQKVHIEFKAGRINRNSLIRTMRYVVGDYTLAKCIRSMHHRAC